MPRTGGSSDTDPARRLHGAGDGGWRRHTGPLLEPGLRAAFCGRTDSKPGALRAPRPPGGASGRAGRGGSPHHGHLWCDAVPGLAGPRSGCEPGSQLGAAPGFRMLHQYGFRAPAPKTRERASAYRVARVERGAAPAPWRACATRAPAEEGARGGAKRAPRPTSPSVRPPRWAPHPEPPLLHQRAAGTATLELSNPTDGSDSGSRGHPRTNAGTRPQPRRGPARAPRAPGHRPEVPQRPTSPSAPPESAQTVNRIKPARLGTAGWTRSPDCTLQATRTPAGSPGGTPALATHPVSL